MVLAMGLVAGCHRDEITEYHAPKDPGSEPPYRLPAGWTEQGARGASLATFGIRGGINQTAEVSIVPFPGEGVGELDLVNITRQAQKPPLPALMPGELAKLTESVDVGAGKGKLIDVSAAISGGSDAPPGRIIVTVFSAGGTTYFIKLAGETELVTAQKPALLGFLKSLSIEFLKSLTITQGSEATATAPIAENSPDAASGEPQWEVPAGWRQVPPTAMLLSKFVIGDAGGAADVTVSVFPGDVGGLLANVNRWRRSVGLADIGAGELERNTSTLDAPPNRATLVDVSGKDPKTGKDARLVGLVWPRGGQTWFFKLMGDAAVVAGQKDAFIKFTLGSRFPNG